MFEPADFLCHRSHRAVHTPRPRAKQNHGKQSEHGGCHHHAEESKSKLRNPWRHHIYLGPFPRQAEGPQQRHRLSERSTGKNPIGAEKHQPEHCHKKCQKAISEPPASQKLRRSAAGGSLQFTAQQLQQLPAAAIAVAIGLVSPRNGHHKRDCKEQHPQPGKKDVAQTQNPIKRLGEPKIFIPLFFICLPSAARLKSQQPDKFLHIFRSRRIFLRQPEL